MSFPKLAYTAIDTGLKASPFGVYCVSCADQTEFDNIVALEGYYATYAEAMADVAPVYNPGTAGSITTDTTGFDNKLSTSDTNLQLALETIDEFAGGVDWTTTQSSAKADGASAVAFDFDTDNTFSTGKIAQWSNNGTQAAYIDSDGSFKVGTEATFNTGIKLYSFGTSSYFLNESTNNASYLYISSKAGIHFGNTDSVAGSTAANSHFFVGSSTRKNGAESIAVCESGKVFMQNLPTSDPAVAGQLWNNSGVLTVSAG